MNELQINVVEFTPTPIKWNKEEVSQVVNEIVSKYQGLEFSEEDVASAKKDRAALNKVAKSLSSKRIDIKKQYSTELTKFEDEVKEQEKLIKDTSNSIDDQIKIFEQKEKDQKHQAIIELEEYKLVEDYNVFNEKWLNKSYKFDDIIEELKQAKVSVDQDINIIKMTSNDKGLDPNNYIDRLKQMELAQVLERIQEDYVLLHNTPVEEVKVEEVEKTKNEQSFEITRILVGTKSQFAKLKSYADSIGVEIRKVGE